MENKDYSLCYWEDYYGQDLTDFTMISYLTRAGKRVWVPIEADIEHQIRELQRTVSKNVMVRVYKEA